MNEAGAGHTSATIDGADSSRRILRRILSILARRRFPEFAYECIGAIWPVLSPALISTPGGTRIKDFMTSKIHGYFRGAAMPSARTRRAAISVLMYEAMTSLFA
jgi:hypothetical protein